MKKLFVFLFAAAMVTLLSVSCRHKVVNDDVNALVDEINDSVLVAKIDGSKVKFDIREAVFTHGAVMYGDSVIINYIGDLSMKRALAKTVFLIERPIVIMEVERDTKSKTDSEPLARPTSPEIVKETNRAVRAAQKYAK